MPYQFVMQLYQLFVQRKSFLMMTALMLGTMLALIIASFWINRTKGIISTPDAHYDYIVVGAGTAGCVLASELASSSQRPKVLLVEAGDMFPWWSSVPLAAPFLQASSYDWAYRTSPQLFSSNGLNNKVSSWPRGRGLGGSGHINYMIHFPGIENDFKMWEEMGILGWSYKKLRSLMNDIFEGKKREHTSCTNNFKLFLNSQEASGICHRTGFQEFPKYKENKLHISSVNSEILELSKAFIEGSDELRLTENKSKYFAPTWSTIKNGFRWSTFDGFLKPVLGKNNLHVLVNSHVSKVLFSDMKRAIGIEVLQRNKTMQIFANKEIILSAGAVNTPQILLLSGVGPEEQLLRHKIPPVQHLPVGLGLHDHLNLPLYVSITKPVSITFSKILRFPEIIQYLLFNKGHLASSGIAGVGSISSKLGIVLFGLGSIDENLLQSIANYKPKVFKTLFPFTHNSSQEGFVLLSSCLQPLSRGIVSLQSKNPLDSPIIDPQYLSNNNDIRCMTEAIKMSASLIKTKPFEILGAQLHLPNLEECKSFNISVNDDLYIECLLRTAAITSYHPGGTCKMGRANDSSTVVDSLLRVHGLQGLRVVDASVLPTPLSGHPNSVIAILAARAASLILNSS